MEARVVERQEVALVWRLCHSGGKRRRHECIERGLVLAKTEEDDRDQLALQTAHRGARRLSLRALPIEVLAPRMLAEPELYHRHQPQETIELPIAEVVHQHMLIASSRTRHRRGATAHGEGVRIAQVARVPRVSHEPSGQDIRYPHDRLQRAVLLRLWAEFRLNLGDLAIQESNALDGPSQVPQQDAIAALDRGELRDAAGELLEGRRAHELRRAVHDCRRTSKFPQS